MQWSLDAVGTPPIVRGSVIRVEVEHLPKPTARAKKTLWLWWSGSDQPDLDRCWQAYLRRFDIEHTFRFAKNTLGWTTPSLCTPEQADRWTELVVAALSQLRLARHASRTSGSHGNDPSTPTSSPRPESDEVFADFAHSPAPQPTHRNHHEQDQDDPKEPDDPPGPATQPSKRPPDPGLKV